MLFPLLAFASVALASELIVLTDENFKEKLAEHKVLFVKMFAPWCGHCKALAPTWEEMANDVNKPGADYFVAECDCVGACKNTCNENGVRGFPTIKMFTAKGDVYDFDGGRSKPELMVWADSMLKPAIAEYATMEEAQEAAKAKGQLIHYVFSGPAVSAPMQAVAEKYKGKLLFSFVHAGETERVTAYREGDPIEMKEAISQATLTRFIEDNRYEYLPRLSNNNFGALARSPGRVVAFVALDPTQHQFVHDEFRKIARAQALAPQQSYADYFAKYVLTDLDGLQWKQFLSEMDLQTQDLPAIVIYSRDSDFATHKLDVNNLVDDAFGFLREHMNGKVTLLPFDKEKRNAANKERDAEAAAREAAKAAKEAAKKEL